MKVELVAVTHPIIDGVATAEEFIAYAARVSNPTNQMNSETAPKLLAYCIRNHHWSVFEMVNLVLEINSTRDIIRQILRHRSFSFQEFSQRYADPTKDLGFELREARLQDDKNRQNSIDTTNENLKKNWNLWQNEIKSVTVRAYQWAIENNIAKEQARAVLPEGMTHSRIYMNGTLRSWIHYCQLRMANGTQKEHMDIAKECWRIIGENCPSVTKALEQTNT